MRFRYLLLVLLWLNPNISYAFDPQDLIRKLELLIAGLNTTNTEIDTVRQFAMEIWPNISTYLNDISHLPKAISSAQIFIEHALPGLEIAIYALAGSILLHAILGITQNVLRYCAKRRQQVDELLLPNM